MIHKESNDDIKIPLCSSTNLQDAHRRKSWAFIVVASVVYINSHLGRLFYIEQLTNFGKEVFASPLVSETKPNHNSGSYVPYSS